jgi:nucleotide-binding universal stress UspA family protein
MSGLPERILVPTDFSAGSTRALTLARTLGRQFAAELHVLHVRQIPDDPSQGDDLLDEVEKLLRSGDSRTAGLLDQLLQDEDAVRVEAHIERRVSVPSAIVEMVSGLGCDLVVMGTHGRKGLQHLLMGSVAEKVMRLSPVPVLTVRDSTKLCDPEGVRILVAHDFSEHSLEAVRYAADWARSLRAEVTLLHSVQPLIYHEAYALEDYHGNVWERVIRRCHETLEEIARRHLSGVVCTTAVVQAHPDLGITGHASESGCDLVVLATRGLSGLEHAIVGSVAERVVRSSPVPVLTVR